MPPNGLPFSGVCVKIFAMRMHRKANLDERLQACSDICLFTFKGEKNMRLAAEQKEYLDFNALFGNDNPVVLEVGCGKGAFVCELAERSPAINFIACEKISNVLIEALELAKQKDLKNVFFLNCAAEVLPKFIPDGRIEKVYLNFSNPLPRKGYEKQRLTHPKFLRIYHSMLKAGGEIVQKTDSRELYEFSLQSYLSEGFEITFKSEDWRSEQNGDILTEHERRFLADGANIFRIVAEVK